MKNKIPNVNVSAEIVVNAPIDEVWQVLAVEFGDVGKWASGVDASEGFGARVYVSNNPMEGFSLV